MRAQVECTKPRKDVGIVRTLFTLVCLRRNTVPSTVAEICFLNNPNGSRNESTRWQTTHNRRHGAPRPTELFEFRRGLASLEIANVSVDPRWGMRSSKVVFKFVAAVKIKLGLDPELRDAISLISIFLRSGGRYLPLASQKKKKEIANERARNGESKISNWNLIQKGFLRFRLVGSVFIMLDLTPDEICYEIIVWEP